MMVVPYVEVAKALAIQITILQAHAIRVGERAERYKPFSTQRVTVMLEVAYIHDQIELLIALSQGKTVQPN